MKEVVYCDESRHDGGLQNPYMAIGSLWMPREQKKGLSKAFREKCYSLGLRGEIKWHKVSRQKLDAYKSLADFFFEQEALKFRAIVVDQRKLDLSRFHGADRELGFYKFYYEMLHHWMEEGNEYLVLLDFIQNKQANRFTELRKVLENKLIGKAWIRDLTVIDSHKTPLGQLVDLLTGAVAAAWCDSLPIDSPKRDFIQYLGECRALPLHQESSTAAKEKLNLFHIRLR
jgi:hypothetical protein